MEDWSLQVFITDTVAVGERNWPQFQVISIAPLLAATIEQFMMNGSISALV